MKWTVLLFTLLLAACSFNDPDDIAYRHVVVPDPGNRLSLGSDYPSIDVTTAAVEFY